MARGKYQTLTEQMFYILLCLRQECCGVDIMEQIKTLTAGRVAVGPGTLYSLLENFVKEGFIRQTKEESRRRSYIITRLGAALLEEEYRRLGLLRADYQSVLSAERSGDDEKEMAAGELHH